MKKVLLISLIIIIIIIILLVILKPFKKKKVISDLSSFHFFYSTGTMINSQVYYDIEFSNNKYILKIKPNNVPEEETKEFELNENQILEIINILNKYEVFNWDGFHKNNKNVLDGDSFNLNLYTKNKDNISASGYMMWPKNYLNVKNELDNYFMNIYKGGEYGN